MSLEFRKIAQAPDYVVGNDGRIVKIRGVGEDTTMRAHDNGHGYMKVQLTVYGERVMLYVHRLVCEAFHGLPPDYADGTAHVRHLNDDQSDNRADNLRWGTPKTNARDRR